MRSYVMKKDAKKFCTFAGLILFALLLSLVSVGYILYCRADYKF